MTENKERIFMANFKSAGVVAQAMPEYLRYFSRRKQLLAHHKVIVAPTAVDISEMKLGILSKNLTIELACQKVSRFGPGSYTGEISAEKLASRGARYAIIGHSEARKIDNLTNDIVWQQAQRAMENNIIPVICVKSIRQAHLSIKDPEFNGIIAFEPLTAVNSENPMDPIDVEKVCNRIKHYYPKAKILYGGSVNEENVQNYIRLPSISGVLIGKKSADAGFFGKIIQAGSI
jgi:triosephosphate isomerase (TIM)